MKSSAKTNTRNDSTARIDAELVERIEKILPLYGRKSINAFVEESVEQMIELIETDKEKRRVPQLVILADASRSPRGKFSPQNVAETAHEESDRLLREARERRRK